MAVAERADGAVVTLKAYDRPGTLIGQGSGFFLPDGRVVTNTHVIEGAARVEVFGRDEELLGSVSHAESLSSAVDLAILPRLGSLPAFLELASSVPAVGEPVVVIGAPLGLSNTVSDGIVSAVRRGEGTFLIQITAPISFGSSGGPVLNGHGAVIGVAVAIMEQGQAINFAVPARDVLALASSPGGVVPFPGSRSGTFSDRTPEREVSPYRRAIGLGDRIEDILTPVDPDVDGRHSHAFEFFGRAGESITVSLVSGDFDAYLYLVMARSDSDWALEDDDGGAGTNAEITVTLPETGVYLIAVTTFEAGETGRYRISVREGRSRSEGHQSGWVRYQSDHESARFYRPDSVRAVAPNIYEIWDKEEHVHPKANEVMATRHDTLLVLWRINCRARIIDVSSVVAYLEGQVVSSRNSRSPGWSPIVPGSIGASLMEAACGR